MDAEEKATRFEFKRVKSYDSTLSKTIVGSIDVGLPVMLGWNAEDYGAHAVLVTGYWEGAERWLILNDPGGMPEISWDSLKHQKKGQLEIGLCKPNTFHVPRPMKWKQRSGDGEPTVYQWTRDGYRSLEEIFGNKNSPSPSLK